ncbi:MAG: sigma-54-dependent Fis family transcriptional regulator [Candidatus Rokubacteria bacterium]|nr:sigma-54-dependent Fis family transcriptional regulator [Candidatus Rokubacteria bacterium]
MTVPAGRILIVDDEEGIRDILSRLVRKEGFEPVTAADGQAALDLIRRESPDVLLLDIKMPGLDGMEVLRQTRELDADLPVIMITGHGFVKGAVEALRAGAHDYLVKPFDHADVIRAVHRAMNDRRLRRTIRILSERTREAASLPDLMGPSDVVARISADVTRVAASDFAVLVTGETGTGKELVARAIHHASPRASAPFIAVDCGAIPETLFESELFGHEKGAFTGAERQKPGKFEAASGGTLFLDEISNMPLGSQAKLLRALQDRSVVRVGGTRPVSVDIRLVAATNADLDMTVAAGGFRRDLYFRLNEFVMMIPPLRERKQDIVFLAKRFLDLTNHELGKAVKGFSEGAVERLLTHEWPGNVRELRSAIRRAVLLADAVIEAAHLGLALAPAPPFGFPGAPNVSTDGVGLKEVVRRATIAVERTVLIQMLKKTGGNKAKAARLLQIDYKTIHTKLKEYGLAVQGGEGDGQAEG